MTQLRPYQQSAVDHFRQRIWRGERFRECLAMPTGSGKTIVMADLLRDPLNQIVISHRCLLLDQIAAVLDRAGIRYGRRAAGYRPDDTANIQLAMAQTEVRRFNQMGTFNADVIHVDEIHCQRGGKFRTVFNEYASRGSVIGYTATPADLSGMVDSVHWAAKVPELVRRGYLCQPLVFSCSQPDLKSLETLRRDATGEYLAGDVSRLVRPRVIFGQVLANYRRLNPDGSPFVLFAHSVKSSVWWAQSLSGKGVPTAHIDGDDVWVDGQFFKSDSAKRKEIFDRVESGDLMGVSNRFVLREGFDCPAIGHAILTCPFGTRKSFVQACGRALRPFGLRQYAIIQDHSGSCISHPALDSGDPWDWRSPPGMAEKIRISEMRNDELPEPIMCPKCNLVRGAGDTCPHCGHRYTKRARYVIQSDGTLKLVHGRAFKPRHVAKRHDDEKVWQRLYWSTVKNSNRTAEQAYAFFAYKNDWRWLPRNLPLMPKREADWFIPLKDVPKSRLYS